MFKKLFVSASMLCVLALGFSQLAMATNVDCSQCDWILNHCMSEHGFMYCKPMITDCFNHC